MSIQKTHKQFIADLKQVNPLIEVLSVYTKSNVKVKCKCLVCGHAWDATPNNLLHGYGCPVCGLEKRVKARTKSIETFKEELKEISPSIKVIGEYEGARVPIKCKCVKCGNIWSAAPTNLLKGKGCPKCAKAIRAAKNRRSHEDFQRIVNEYHPNIVFLEKFKGNASPIKAKCLECGYEWTTTASSLVYGHGCPRCAKNGIYTQQEFVEKLKSVNPFIVALSEYERAAKPIKCKCLRCGHVWESKPNNLLSGKGCPDCFHSTTSFVEQAILLSLKTALPNTEVLHRNRRAIGKELDIYIPSLHIAIEPGSWKWHQNKLKNDTEKRRLCEQNGIRLITIYSDYNEAEKPFEADCIVVKETLGYEKENDSLSNLIKQLLQLCDIDYHFSESEWSSIITNSYDKSRRITTEEYKKRVEKVNENIVITGEYTGSWNSIDCKCKICGYEWSPSANSILQGHGCPHCGHLSAGEKRRKDPSTFRIELSMINPNIVLTEEYQQSNKKVGCRCLKCGYEWKVLPTNLLKGRGCPVCANRILLPGVNDLASLRPDLLSEWDYEKNTVSPKEVLIGQKMRIWWKCPNGHSYSADLGHRTGKAKTGCPYCGRAKTTKANKKAIVQLDKNGILVRQYDSAKEAELCTGISRNAICGNLKNRTKSAGGYIWKYKE